VITFGAERMPSHCSTGEMSTSGEPFWRVISRGRAPIRWVGLRNNLRRACQWRSLPFVDEGHASMHNGAWAGETK
jgi:hypothetical protein